MFSLSCLAFFELVEVEPCARLHEGICALVSQRCSEFVALMSARGRVCAWLVRLSFIALLIERCVLEAEASAW